MPAWILEGWVLDMLWVDVCAVVSMTVICSLMGHGMMDGVIPRGIGPSVKCGVRGPCGGQEGPLAVSAKTEIANPTFTPFTISPCTSLIGVHLTGVHLMHGRTAHTYVCISYTGVHLRHGRASHTWACISYMGMHLCLSYMGVHLIHERASQAWACISYMVVHLIQACTSIQAYNSHLCVTPRIPCLTDTGVLLHSYLGHCQAIIYNCPHLDEF